MIRRTGGFGSSPEACGWRNSGPSVRTGQPSSSAYADLQKPG
jgi:hypothetical protein